MLFKTEVAQIAVRLLLVGVWTAGCAGEEATHSVAGAGVDVADATSDSSPDDDATNPDTETTDASTGIDGSPDATLAAWGTPCSTDDECTEPADYCVIPFGQNDGYCAARCVGTSACIELGAPAGWTCNTVEFLGCDDPATNWCAPPEELRDNAEFLIECTP